MIEPGIIHGADQRVKAVEAVAAYVEAAGIGVDRREQDGAASREANSPVGCQRLERAPDPRQSIVNLRALAKRPKRRALFL